MLHPGKKTFWRRCGRGLAGAVLLALGLALVRGGLTTARDDLADWRQRSLPAIGTVLALEENTSYSGGEGRARVTAFPVIAFVTQDGRTVTYRDPAPNTIVQEFVVGETVPVRYDPVNPAVAGLDTPLTGNAPSVIIFLVGAGLAGAGGWLLLRAVRRPRA